MLKSVFAFTDCYVIKQTVLENLLDDDYIDRLDCVSTTEYEGNRRNREVTVIYYEPAESIDKLLSRVFEQNFALL